jgi:hypothetical protein
MKPEVSHNAHRGSDFRDFLAGEGILPEVEVLALKRAVSLQLQEILEQERVTKTELASRMKTSRASLDRMLDPSNPSLTVASLGKAAAALGRKVELRFVPV